MAAPNGNRLSIIGCAHIDGIGDLDEATPIEKVHGTFGHHLLAAGQRQAEPCPHHVTRAVIATAAGAKGLDGLAKDALYFYEPNRAAANTEVAHLNLDTGQVGTMWQPPPDHERVVPLEDKFPTPDVLNSLRDGPHKDRGREYHKKAHLDPMMLPDLRKKANAVRAAMNPELALDRPR
ncbi:MAG: hypothetical protein K2X09_05320 [Rickettsiales bacterium]|nr:hypothetical protein [Rickettsiales bacterium]